VNGFTKTILVTLLRRVVARPTGMTSGPRKGATLRNVALLQYRPHRQQQSTFYERLVGRAAM